MKDIPIFTTEWGIASLLLKEIPYRQEAFIRIRSAAPGGLSPLLEECITFCRMAGAEKIYAEGDEGLQSFDCHAVVLKMRGHALVDLTKVRCLFPVTEATVAFWRKIYNERMQDVDCAATLTAFDEKDLTNNPGAYFVHRDGELLGIGLMEDTKLRAICSVKQGTGEEILHTLLSLVEGEYVSLEVASTNLRGRSLYEKFGFITVSEGEHWYRVFPPK